MSAPLAERLRPHTLSDMVGQPHLLGQGCALRNIVQSGELPNLIFYGPSGVGKTTLARIIARQTERLFISLNGTTAGTADIKETIAKSATLMAPNGVLLYLDEIQYFNKKQQQTLLEFIENGSITLIASTAENPYFYVYSAILSRSTVFEFKPVEPAEVEKAVNRALDFLREESGTLLEAEAGVAAHIAAACGGDVRKAINAVELCALSADTAGDGGRLITLDIARELTQKSTLRYDRDGDEHYDILSAFQKSMRGSDADAAVHYLARLVEAGDLPSICRRLMVCACEDVGLAYPQIIPIVKACVDAALQIGFPEAQIPLADGVILVCTSPKSNTGVTAVGKALADIQTGFVGDIPAHLRDSHYNGAEKRGHGLTYQYPHSFPHGWTPQQYLPDSLKNRTYYEYGENRVEQAAKAYWGNIKGASQTKK